MCLVKSHKFPKKAKEDITVYKVIIKNTLGNYYTPIAWKKVELGKPICGKHNIFFGIFFDGLTTCGVHSYTDYDSAYALYMDIVLSYGGARGKVQIHNAIIPKGSFYYEGLYHDIISSKLIIV